MTHREILEVLVGLLAALFTAILSHLVSNALPTIIADLQGSQTRHLDRHGLAARDDREHAGVGQAGRPYSKKLLVQTAIVTP